MSEPHAKFEVQAKFEPQAKVETQISSCENAFSVLVKFSTGNPASDMSAPGKLTENTTIGDIVKQMSKVAGVDEKNISIVLVADKPLQTATTTRDDDNADDNNADDKTEAEDEEEFLIVSDDDFA